jgi:PAS domain S-box-containing protein
MSTADITLLHVDDDDGFRGLLRDFFEREFDDIGVVSASSGDDALARLAREDVDCVVSDYEMPGTTGLELLATVRDQWPDLPFVLFTGRGDEETAIDAIGLGVTDYLQKRSGVGQYTILANRVRNVVARHRAEVELALAAGRTEAQFELLVDTVEDYAVFLLDVDGTVQTWNRGAEKIKRYPAEEVVGEHFSVFYTEADAAAGVPERNLREAAAEGRIRDEGWRLRRDGSTFWADVTITALYDGGDLVGYAKITRDSTQHHHERLLLERSERWQAAVAGLVHDLRTPLSVAAGDVHRAAETGDCSTIDATAEALDRATDLLDHLGTIAEGSSPTAGD